MRFDAEQVQQHDSEIVTRYNSEHSVEVHLGFLQINHYYEITFSIKDNLSEDLTSDPLQNLHAKATKIVPSEDGKCGLKIRITICFCFTYHNITIVANYALLSRFVIELIPGEGHVISIEFTAYKEKLVREELTLKDSQDPTKEITLKIHARVLGELIFITIRPILAKSIDDFKYFQ